MKGSERLYYTIEVRDRNGKLLRRFTRRAHSFVRQWNELHCVQAKASAQTIKDIGGTERSINYSDIAFVLAAGAGSENYGMRVGTGFTAVTISDYALGTAIAHGTGSGELNHYACTVGDPSVAGSECSFTITRVFGNETGATITVKEMGEYMRLDATYYGLAWRDVLASPIDVPDGGAMTVVYTYKVSV